MPDLYADSKRQQHRDIEGLLAERGVTVSHESIRLHSLKTEKLEAEEYFELDAEPVEKVEGAPDANTTDRGRLEAFDDTIIAKQFPNTPKDRRLLRPAMIEALVEHEPVASSEFVELIPEYLRKSTEPKEAKAYLAQVLEIVAGSEVSQGY